MAISLLDIAHNAFVRRIEVNVRCKYRGFTMIELLTVIGIIVILAGLLLAVRGVFSGAGKSSTQVTLKNLQGMMSELEVIGPLKTPNMWHWAPTTIDISTSNPNGLDFWKIPYRASASADPTPLPAIIVADGTASRYGSTAVINTQIVMSRVLAVKNNQDAIAKLPSSGQMNLLVVVQKAIDGEPAGSPLKGQYTTAKADILKYVSNTDRYPLILDAWKNPIIYVPASGLGVRAATVAADGSVPAGALKTGGQSSGDITIVKTSPDGKGFFASAGPDGNFQTGDDNVYSFEQ